MAPIARPGRRAVHILPAVLVALVLAGWLASRAGASVYVGATDAGQVVRADLDGTSPAPLATGTGDPTAIAVAPPYLFWADGSTGDIGRVDLDGSDAEPDFITTGTGSVSGVAADGDHVYWTDTQHNTIGRANLDGTGITPRFITGLSLPVSVAVDNDHIYWADQYPAAIGRADIDGTNADAGFITGMSGPRAVAVDDRYVFWLDSPGRIGRAAIDGSAVDQGLFAVTPNLTGLAADDRYVYWSDGDASRVGRMGVDGSAPNSSFLTGLSGPVGLAVDGGPTGTASASAPGLDFGTQALGTLGAPQTVTITNTGHGMLPLDPARISGTDPDDFLITGDGCGQVSLWPGDSCAVHLRFRPSTAGFRDGLLALSTGGSPATTVSLIGTGGSPPTGAAGRSGSSGPAGEAGATGATGSPGPAGTIGASGPVGATGATGPRGPEGPSGRVQLVTCTKTGTGRHRRTRCTTRTVTGPVQFTLAPGTTAHATLVRGGHVAATGTARVVAGQVRVRLRATTTVRHGRYTLRLRYRSGRRTLTTARQIRL